MTKELFFSGDELELLVAMDASGCVLTDDGKFYCDLENEKLAMRSRLPVRVKGSYGSCENGWRITYRMQPAPRTILIGVLLAVLLVSNLLTIAAAEGSWTGSVLFGILIGALVVNYGAQYKSCVRRFENAMRK